MISVKEYNRCVDLYADGIYRFILKNMKDEDLSKDVVQDTFEKLWRKKDEVSPEKVKSYLFTTAYHTMIDYLRKNNRISDMEQVNENEHYTTRQYTDLKEVLNKLVELLPPVQKSVLLLRDYEGYSYKEIAEITGLNESQVKVYIYRARVFLKNKIKSVDVLI